MYQISIYKTVNLLTVAYSKSSKPRLVLDSRYINPLLHQNRFKYEDDKVAGEMLDVGDFIFICDLQSAYHHIEIFEVHQQYLSFAWFLKAKYNILPFCISTAGYIC